MRIIITKDTEVEDGFGNVLKLKKNKVEHVKNDFGRKLIKKEVAKELPIIAETTKGKMIIEDGKMKPLKNLKNK